MGFLSSLRRDLKGGTKSYKSLNKERAKWVAEQMAAEGFKKESQSFEMGGDSGGWYSQEVYTDPKAFQRENQLRNEWYATLPPEKRAKAMHEFGQHSSDMGTINKYGSLAAKGIIGAAAGGAALSALGGGGAAGSGLGEMSAAGMEGAGYGTVGSAEAGLGYGGYGGAGGTVAGQGGALGGTSIASGASPLGSLGVDAATAVGNLGGVGSSGSGLLGSAGGSVGTAGSALGTVGSALGTVGSALGSLAPSGLGSLASNLAGIGGLVNSLRKPETPDTVDFQQLAKDQAAFDKQAMDDSLLANRTNQTNAQGDTQSWTQNPDGTWSQKQTFGESNQRLFDQSQNIRSGLLGQAAQAGPLTTEGLPDVGGPLMSARGNNKDIQDAWMSRIAPERDRQRQNEYARLAGMGLTEGTPAFANAMRQLNEADTDAQNQALIYGTQEYGNEYNRDIQGRQSQQNARTSMFNQRQQVADQPYRNLSSLAGSTPGNPVFGAQVNRGTPTSTQTYQAGKDAYGQDVANTNVANVQRGNLTDGLYGLANTIAKGGWGKP